MILPTIPITQRTIPLVASLLKTIAFHGGTTGNPLLMVADKAIPQDSLDPLIEAAKPLFSQGRLIRTPLTLPNESYPYGDNWRFATAAKHIAQHMHLPWLWLDPRCVPMRRGWLRELEASYTTTRKPFLGIILTPEKDGTPAQWLASVAIYPAELPKRMLQRLASQRGTAWEQSCADLVVPVAGSTKLLWTQPLNGSTPKCVMRDVPSQVALAHTAAALSLGCEVRGESAYIVSEPLSPKLKLEFNDAVKTARQTFYHSGDLGDVIYALTAIRLAGGGSLMLGPQQKRTPSAANPIKEDRFEMFAPLLRLQPYLKKVSFAPRYPGTDAAFDLNVFRSNWGDKSLRARTGINNLARMHCHVLGVNEKFHPYQTWLNVPSPIVSGMFTVHRSPRYRADNERAFPWPMVLKRFAGKLLFVGLPSEHADFQRTFNVRTAFYHCYDFLDMARVIAGSRGFIGNQSFPMAIALGVGQRVLQESWHVSPDCLFPRPNFLAQPFTNGQLEQWIASPRSKNQTAPEKAEPPKPIEATVEVKPFTIVAPAENFTGYGQLTNAICEGLANRGINFSASPFAVDESKVPLASALKERITPKVENPDLLICSILEVHHRIKPGAVLFTMWEASKIDEKTVAAINANAVAVIVPNQWNQKCFKECGVTVPIVIVPLGVDPTVYRFIAPQPTKTFHFGTAGRLAHAGVRKGVEETISCFREAFPSKPNVRLHVKIFDDCKLPDFSDDSRIIYVRRFLPQDEMVRWYANLDCFVSMTKGEGWGLHIHQAMAIGRPVIVPCQGGQAEFVIPDTTYCCRYKMEKPDWSVYKDAGEWCVPDTSHCVELMRHVVENRKEARQMGQMASESVAKFTWNNTVNKLVETLRQFKKLC